MLFNSVHYALFLLVVLFVVDTLRRRGHQQTMLLVGSYYFYWAFSSAYVLLIVVSTLVDFYCGQAIYRAQSVRRRRLFLAVSLATQLGLLAYFKYANFAIDSVRALLGAVGLPTSAVPLEIVLPVGISFYTFMTLSYTLDIYSGRFRPVDSLRTFALYVTFFPHLVAGPILRAADFLPQLGRPIRLNGDNLRAGGALILAGLVKKTVFADNLAGFTRDIFTGRVPGDPLSVYVGSVAFAVQIYCDFSGYTDIAIGSARLFGLQFPGNFRWPYFSASITDFWRRWHMSLSAWLRDYLYIPLGGNRKGRRRQYANLMLTMMLGGLWHGASWNFVLWGTFHGGLLAGERALGERVSSRRTAFGQMVRPVITFWLTCVGWVIFVVPDLGRLAHYLQRLAFIGGPEPRQTSLIGADVLAPIFVFAALHAVSHRVGGLAQIFGRQPAPVWAACAATAGIGLFLFAAGYPRSFIYFQF